MIAISLQSGSNGNCTYVEAGGARLLFDAGISGIEAERRLARFGIDIRGVDALLVSHDHVDHARCAGIYGRKYGLPVYATAATLRAAARRCGLGRIPEPRTFRSGDALRIGAVTVETLPTPHDGVDGVVFAVDDGNRRLGVMTDLGHVFDGLGEAIASLDAVLLESNHDLEMLANGPYPAFLKRRIRGPGGHLSNDEAASLVGAAGGRLRWACLAHLSQENNAQDVALATWREILGPRLPLHVAGRNEPTPVLEI
jgi:phosphoribosyl 1,2-cyclic phosphodiesterase